MFLSKALHLWSALGLPHCPTRMANELSPGASTPAPDQKGKEPGSLTSLGSSLCAWMVLCLGKLSLKGSPMQATPLAINRHLTHTCVPRCNSGCHSLNTQQHAHFGKAPSPTALAHLDERPGVGLHCTPPSTPRRAAPTPTDPALLSSLLISKRLSCSVPDARAGCPTACLRLWKRRDPGGHLLGQGTRKPHGDHTSSPWASHASSPYDLRSHLRP